MQKRERSCPVCFVPLSITLNLRGVDDDGGLSCPTARGQNSPPDTCIICMENPRNALILPCGHMFTCMECCGQLQKRNCPICRQQIQKVVKTDGNDGTNGKSAVVGRKSILQKLNMSEFASSTKVEAVVKAIGSSQKKESHAKAIVFSQYVTMIDLVEWRLKQQGIRAVKLVGSMPVTARRSTLTAFKTDPSVKVVLMSLKAGGEGLNLQEATHVYVLEPWWNPAVEMQAIQRAHRIGQQNKVTAVRFITKDTIEEKKNQLQEKKRLVFEGTVDCKAASLAQLTEDDLRFLFH